LKRRVGVIGLNVLIAIVFVLKSSRYCCAALPVSPDALHERPDIASSQPLSGSFSLSTEHC
jgi:hypothetical protein